MRPIPGILAALVLTVSASAEVVAGRGHILFHNAWTPLAGAALTPLGLPVESAAFDGERFLLAWRDTEAVRLGLFDEGATTPVTVVSLEAAPGTPFVRWDGTRYVVVVASEPAQIAIVSPQGVLEHRASIPEAHAVVDVAASASGIALAARYSTGTHAGVVDVLLLDSAYQVAARTTVGSIIKSSGFGTTWIGRVVIAPLANAFYVVWEETRSARYQQLSGTRVLLDGSAPDVVPSRRERDSLSGTPVDAPDYAYPNPYAVLLHPYHGRLAVTMLRDYSYGLTTAFIDERGTATSGGYRTGLFFLPETTRSVRLVDGSIVVVYEENGVAVVRPLIPASAPAPPPRRRSARH